MRNIFITVLLALMMTTLEAKQRELDHIALAALLIRDGHYDRALKSLAEVDLKDEDTDFKRFYTLKALALMKQEHYVEAIEAFNKAIKQGQEDKMIYINIAKSYFKLEKYSDALAAFDQAKTLVMSKPQYMALKAEMLWKSKAPEKALDTVNSAIEKFKSYAPLYKQKFFYLIDLKLYKSAMDFSKQMIAVAKDRPKALMIAAQALIRNKQLDDATLLLTEGMISYPKKSDIIVMLAHVYMKKHQLNAAADLFDEASLFERKYIKEASELYRRAKKFYRSLYLNTQIKDQKEKFRQRLAIFLEFEDYESASAMRKVLSRVGLLKEEDMRYALAFALFKSGQYDQCEKELSQLTRSDLFSKAIELRKSIELCKAKPWECQ